MILKVIKVFVILFYSNLALAENIPIIVISPGKSPQSKSIVGSDINVINENEISNSNEFFIGDVINQFSPGMSMFQSGGYGTVTGIQMRGLPGRYSTIYINFFSLFLQTQGHVLSLLRLRSLGCPFLFFLEIWKVT